MDTIFHESDERLELYALDRLSDSDVVRIEEHLLVCDLCRDRLDETAIFAFSMREELARPPAVFNTVGARWLGWLKQSGPVGSWMKPQFALAGTFAAVLLAVLIFRGGQVPVAPVASLQLTAMRGTDVKAVAPSRELDLTFGDAQVSSGSLSVEVVDSEGSVVWQGKPATGRGGVNARISKSLAPGEYYARLYDAPGRLVHEYAFRIKK